MKYKLHITTKEYCFIEAEVEGTMVDAVKAYGQLNTLLALDSDRLAEIPSGLNVKEYAEVRRTLLMTGEFDVNLEDRLNYAQLRWVKDTNNTLRDIKKEE